MGTEGAWGVEDHGGIIYEPDFSKAVAEAIADMLNSEFPPSNWFETEARLIRRGLLEAESS